jgi:hypothetical protein
MLVRGKNRQGQIVEEPLFSDFQIQLDRSYYIGASFAPARPEGPGQAVFYLKDLANEDEPLRTASVPHQIMEVAPDPAPMILGGREASRENSAWDGLIDEIRIHNGALDPSQLSFLKNEAIPSQAAIAYTFENPSNPMADALGRHSPLTPTLLADALPPREQALADYCQALLSSSEFLYLR